MKNKTTTVTMNTVYFPDGSKIYRLGSGQKDKNGNEIFDGDIIKIKIEGTESQKEVIGDEFEQEQNTFIEQVVFTKGAFMVFDPNEEDEPDPRSDLLMYYSETCEVIGNVYEK